MKNDTNLKQPKLPILIKRVPLYMVLNVRISTTYRCSLERAFKTPMLCELSKIHTGFIVMPKVTHVSKDADWGQPGSSKIVHVQKSLTQGGGFGFVDRILERQENEYWKIQVDDYQFWMMGFSKFVGEWKTTQLAHHEIKVEYSYALHSNSPIFYPINWLFAKTFWKIYMRRVLENVRDLAYAEEPYLYD